MKTIHALLAASLMAATGPLHADPARSVSEYCIAIGRDIVNQADAAAKAHEHVLGPTGQQPDVADVSRRKSLRVHPRIEHFEVDELAVDSGFHSGVFRGLVSGLGHCSCGSGEASLRPSGRRRLAVAASRVRKGSFA